MGALITQDFNLNAAYRIQKNPLSDTGKLGGIALVGGET
jgi:hypothetical protein